MAPLLLLLTLWSSTEVLDRLAVSVGNSVITESQIRHQLKIRAFVDSSPLVLNGEAKRAAADRLIEQTLIRREMQSARYTMPEAAQADGLLTGFIRTRFGGDDARFRTELTRAGLTEEDVRSAFLWQLSVLRFVEYRFRPGIQVPEEEVREFYEKKFSADWKKNHPQEPVPAFDQASATIEELLIQERIDNQLDRWISQSRTQVDIRYRDEVFK